MKNKSVSVETFGIKTVEVFDLATAFRILLTTFTFVGAFAAVFPLGTLDGIHMVALNFCAVFFSRLVIGPPTRIEFTDESADMIATAVRNSKDEED